MKRKAVIFLILWIFFILQTTVFHMIPALSAAPNLLLILTVSIGFMQGHREGVMTGFVSGLLIDLFYGSFIGYYALLYLLIGYFCGFFAHIYFDEDIRVPLFLVGVSDFLYNFVIYVCFFLLRGRMNFGGYLIHVIFPEMVCTLIFTLILYKLLYKINHSMVEKEKKGKQSLWIRD